MAIDKMDLEELTAEINDDLANEVEDTRALAEHYAERIYPKSDERLAEVKVVEGKTYIVMTSHGAHIDEFGSVFQPPNAPLRRAIDATGLRFEPTPKP